MIEGTIRKVISANDVGSTKSHQAGMLIPRDSRILAFFPKLEADAYNPRQSIVFEDTAGQRLKFNFIHYNNKLHGKGTRNEYRLTCMTKFMRQAALKAGDAIVFKRRDNQYSIDIERKNAINGAKASNRLVLEAGWILIDE